MKIVFNYLFSTPPPRPQQTNTLRYQVNLGVITSVYVCVGVYQKSSFFFVLFLFVGFIFNTDFVLLLLCFLVFFSWSLEKFWKSFMDLSLICLNLCL